MRAQSEDVIDLTLSPAAKPPAARPQRRSSKSEEVIDVSSSPDQVRRMARLALGTAWLLADR